MKLEVQVCLKQFSKYCDIATDWLIDYINEIDPIERQINYLHYRKADKERLTLARRLNKLCQG